MLEPESKSIFLKYKNALIAIGSDNWIIKGIKYEGKWKLEQLGEHRWLLQFNDAPRMILNTEEVIKSFKEISGKVNKVINSIS